LRLSEKLHTYGAGPRPWSGTIFSCRTEIQGLCSQTTACRRQAAFRLMKAFRTCMSERRAPLFFRQKTLVIGHFCLRAALSGMVAQAPTIDVDHTSDTRSVRGCEPDAAIPISALNTSRWRRDMRP